MAVVVPDYESDSTVRVDPRYILDTPSKGWLLSRIHVENASDTATVQFGLGGLCRVATSGAASGDATWEIAPTIESGGIIRINTAQSTVDGELYVWHKRGRGGVGTGVTGSGCTASIVSTWDSQCRGRRGLSGGVGDNWLGGVHYRIPFGVLDASNTVDDDDQFFLGGAGDSTSGRTFDATYASNWAWEPATSSDTARLATVANGEIRFLTGGASGIAGHLHIWYQHRPRENRGQAIS